MFEKPLIQSLTCNNPSVMTLEGTRTYILGSEHSDEVVLVDPGPEGHPEHLDALMELIGTRTLVAILLTHRHSDHTGAAPEMSRRTNAPIRSFESSAPLQDGEEIIAGDLIIQALHTPGHTSDSMCFWLPQASTLLTGDTVLGKGTTMLDFPDGTLEDYLETLEFLGGLASSQETSPEAPSKETPSKIRTGSSHQPVKALPAHGPDIEQLDIVVKKYLDHRYERLTQTKELLQQHGELTASELGQLIYGNRTSVSAHIIEQIAASQLKYLENCSRL